MEKSNNNWYEMSDLAIMENMGEFIKETRLRQNKTQSVLAHESGIDRFTIVRMENGKGGTLKTLIQLLRSLEQLHLFQPFQITTQISPLTLAKLERTKRQRASGAGKRPSRTKKSEW